MEGPQGGYTVFNGGWVGDGGGQQTEGGDKSPLVPVLIVANFFLKQIFIINT